MAPASATSARPFDPRCERRSVGSAPSCLQSPRTQCLPHLWDMSSTWKATSSCSSRSSMLSSAAFPISRLPLVARPPSPRQLPTLPTPLLAVPVRTRCACRLHNITCFCLRGSPCLTSRLFRRFPVGCRSIHSRPGRRGLPRWLTLLALPSFGLFLQVSGAARIRTVLTRARYTLPCCSALPPAVLGVLHVHRLGRHLGRHPRRCPHRRTR